MGLLFWLCSPKIIAQEKTTVKNPYESPSLDDVFVPTTEAYTVEYDSSLGMYVVQKTIGGIPIDAPLYLTLEQYNELSLKQSLEDNYQELNKAASDGKRVVTPSKEKGKDKPLIPTVKVNSKVFETIFGGNEISFTPRGYLSVDLGIFRQKIDNPQLQPQNRTNFTFDLEPRFQLGINAKIGSNLDLNLNYDNQASFQFDNRMNLAWDGKEDNIIKRAEFGNVSLPLSTSLITGAQSLFGAKTQMQFGDTYVTAVVSQQQSQSQRVMVENGSVVNKFKISAVDYQDNQHYFLSQYFRNQYDSALKNYPLVASSVQISKIEVWIIDRGNSDLKNQRTIASIYDLGEEGGLPNNGTEYQAAKAIVEPTRDYATSRENLKARYTEGDQFVVHAKVRRLNPNQFQLEPKLGYISLNQRLEDDQLLAVAYQYTVNGESTVYQVGEFSDQEQNLLLTKLLKSNTVTDTSSGMWDLMMKNIYPTGGFDISSQDFKANLYYNDPSKGKSNYLPSQDAAFKNVNLLQITNMDRLNANGDQQRSGNLVGDGQFDYLPGITIKPEKGQIVFTQVEPFGGNLVTSDGDFSFQELYNQQKTVLLSSNKSSRFTLEGAYSGSGGEGIYLGAINIPEGSVKVSLAGRELVENVDYLIDYQGGTLTVLNEEIKNQGQALDIQLENQSTFNLQNKSFVGVNVEQKFSDQFYLAGTVLHYNERPLTQKSQYGLESASNTMLGLNTSYTTPSKALSNFAQRISSASAEVESKITVNAEAAMLIPGISNIGNQTFIDDFETVQTKINLKDANAWSLAATPQENPEFPNVSAIGSLESAKNRALFSWYNIDSRFYGIGGDISGVDDNARSLHMARRINLRELFPNNQNANQINTYVTTLDLTTYPTEPGPYNTDEGQSASSRWAGITRPLSVTNFAQSNIQYLEFWVMDPYADNTGSSGELLIHIGNVSEDILKDGNQQFENGLPAPGVESSTQNSVFGVQPLSNPVVYAFETQESARGQQDLGLDGLSNELEAATFGGSYTNPVTQSLDPAKDDYVFFNDNRWAGTPFSASVVDRYRYFRGSQGNSPSASLDAATQFPDVEDANRDYNLDQVEKYNQYRIKISKADLENVGSNFVVDKKTVNVTLQNTKESQITWYQIRIPVDQFESGSMANLNTARYIRFLMKGFDSTTTLRLGTLDLVKSNWQIFDKNIYPQGSANSEGVVNAQFRPDVGVVSIEENEQRKPPYVLPPGVSREESQGTQGYFQRNEQSLAITTNDFSNSSVAVFKKANLDLRRYKNLSMHAHGEDLNNVSSDLYDSDAKVFIRLGSDYTDNYYEYEISLKYTPDYATTVDQIWPDLNYFNINIEDLVNAKQERDSKGQSTSGRYQKAIDANRSIYIKGRPTLGSVTSVMIGVRNNSSQAKNLLVWVNELRLSEVENDGGFATRANVNFNLADLADVQVNAGYASVGFGALDSTPTTRSQETNLNYGINTLLNLDKFLPKNFKLKLPLSVSYNNALQTPKYNPLEDDVIVKETYNKNAIEQIVQTQTQNTTIGLNGVRFEKPESREVSMPWSPENFVMSMNYSTSDFRDIQTEKSQSDALNASLGYQYSPQLKPLEPFKKLPEEIVLEKKPDPILEGQNTAQVKKSSFLAKLLNPKNSKEEEQKPLTINTAWLSNFQLQLVPTRVSVNSFLNRNFSLIQYRDIDYLLGNTTQSQFQPLVNNRFNLGWNYGLGFDLTKSLKLDFRSDMLRTVSGGQYLIDSNSLFQNLFDLGRPIQYDHSINVNYQLPTSLFPSLDFVSSNLNYTGGYHWTAASVTARELGNFASNNYSLTLGGNLAMEDLYHNISGLDDFYKRQSKRKEEIQKQTEKFKSAVNKEGKTKAKVSEIKTKYKPVDYGYMLLTSIKNVGFTVGNSGNTVLPGVLTHPNLVGLQSDGISGPDLAFVLGQQKDYRQQALDENWLSQSSFLTNPYQQNHKQTISANMVINPMDYLNINLNALSSFGETLTHSGFNLDKDPQTPGFQGTFANEMKTYNVSTISLGSSFLSSDALYLKVIENAKAMSKQLGGTPDGSGYAPGYGIASSDVAVPAFLATYTGRSLNSGFKSAIPLPNWNLSYTGLNKISPVINKYFDQFNISHGYQSTYGIGAINNLQFLANQGILTLDNNQNFYTPYTYNQVTVTESLSPLVGIDFRLRNGVQFNSAYSINNISSLSMSNYTITEDRLKTLTLGAGYTFKDLKTRVNYRGQQTFFKGDLNLRADVSLTQGENRITRLIENQSQFTGGQDIMSFKFLAGYNLTKNFNLQFFYDQNISTYKISTIYPLNTLRTGLSATFTFGD
ncbi:MAG: cell surface protein SprA [Flavobacteriaceae bacterium]|nr:MAG: cell surface protein SprA [Flavobacteriaceae bacterium]